MPLESRRQFQEAKTGMKEKEVIQLVNSRLSQLAHPEKRAWWENYVKNGAPFLGVPMEQIRKIVREISKELDLHDLDRPSQLSLMIHLIQKDYTEEKLAGMILYQDIMKAGRSTNSKVELSYFKDLFMEGYLYDWNLCDWFCMKVLGELLKAHGMPVALELATWRSQQDLWCARASLVPFASVSDQRQYYPLIRKCASDLILRDERFAKTAVGWVLREVSRHDKGFVQSILEKSIKNFSHESLRNATKYFGNRERRLYLSQLK